MLVMVRMEVILALIPRLLSSNRPKLILASCLYNFECLFHVPYGSRQAQVKKRAPGFHVERSFDPPGPGT